MAVWIINRGPDWDIVIDAVVTAANVIDFSAALALAEKTAAAKALPVMICFRPSLDPFLP